MIGLPANPRPVAPPLPPKDSKSNLEGRQWASQCSSRPPADGGFPPARRLNRERAAHMHIVTSGQGFERRGKLSLKSGPSSPLRILIGLLPVLGIEPVSLPSTPPIIRPRNPRRGSSPSPNLSRPASCSPSTALTDSGSDFFKSLTSSVVSPGATPYYSKSTPVPTSLLDNHALPTASIYSTPSSATTSPLAPSYYFQHPDLNEDVWRYQNSPPASSPRSSEVYRGSRVSIINMKNRPPTSSTPSTPSDPPTTPPATKAFDDPVHDPSGTRDIRRKHVTAKMLGEVADKLGPALPLGAPQKTSSSRPSTSWLPSRVSNGRVTPAPTTASDTNSEFDGSRALKRRSHVRRLSAPSNLVARRLSLSSDAEFQMSETHVNQRKSSLPTQQAAVRVHPGRERAQTDPEAETADQKRARRRRRAIQELVETEQSYASEFVSSSPLLESL
jgi:hypothetical protein